MKCCQCQGIESIFDYKMAQKELASYRKKGPEKTTQMLLDALKTAGVSGKSLIDIGGGVGVIQHELAAAGIGRIVNVDASSGYLKTAQEEAKRRGYDGRSEYNHGDFVDLAPDIETADIVTLDRVLCCYHDVESLVKLSVARTGQWYGVVYPRDAWWIKLAKPLLNLGLWLRRNPFRVFIHPTKVVDHLVREQGFKQKLLQHSLIWQVVLYQKDETT